MDTQSIIAAIDEDIRRLQGARAVLAETVKDSAPAAATSKTRKRRRLSKQEREAIQAAQRQRWAATKGAVKAAAAKPEKKAAPAKKRKLSVAARKRIAAAQKK